MGPALKRSVMATSAIAVMILVWSAAPKVAGQTPAYKAQRTVDGQPDINGFWQSMTTANWDIEEHGAAKPPHVTMVGAYLAQPPGFSIVEGGTIPYKPEALERRKTYFENRLNPDPVFTENWTTDKSNPEAKCFQGGVPRALYMPYPFQVIQSTNKILMAHQWGGSPRVIHMGRDMEKTRANLLNIDSWMGQSVGRWEGETLVVDTRWFSHTIWLDRAGNHYSSNAVVVERFTPATPYHMNYEATITDPETFTRPWKLSVVLYKHMDPKMEYLEFQCIPLVEDFNYGKYYKKPVK